MVRTQIQITREQAATLRKIAGARGVSLAELIRQGIDLFLRQAGGPDERAKRRRALNAAGRLRGGPRDLARRHDQHLSETYGR